MSTYLLCSIVYPLENLPEGSLSYPLLLSKDYLWIHFL